MSDTIFGKILDGDIPCHRVYEDEHVLAFLDVGPLSRGHTLMIPRERVARIEDLSDDAAAAVGRALPRLCRAITEATGADAYNVLLNAGAAAGQEVMHVHFHIIPKHGDAGLVKRWKPGTLDADDAAALAASITERLA
jgi:histidine triad (HIT) family protein